VIEPTGPEGGMDVPRRAVASDTRRGVWLVMALGVAVVGVAVVGGRLASEQLETAVASPARTPSQPVESATRRATARPATVAPTPSLPALASQILPFPGLAAILRRDGDALELLGWRSGEDAFRELARADDAFVGIGPGALVLAELSPDGRHVLLATFDPLDGAERQALRLVSIETGEVVWSTNERLPGPGGLLWSPDSRLAVFTPPGDRWLVLELDENGQVTRRIVDGIPTRPGVEGSDSEFVTPVGFSGNHRWLYAASIQAEILRPSFRMDTRRGQLEPIEAFPIRGRRRLVPVDVPYPAVDPASGRTMSLPMSGGGVRVTDADGRAAFILPVARLQGLGWTDDGDLLLFETTAGTDDASTQLVPVGRNGARGDPIFEVPAYPAAFLSTVRDGYAGLVFLSDPERTGFELVLVRLSDGATSVVHVEAQTLQTFVAFDWFDPSA
jgi:hypothetical protein